MVVVKSVEEMSNEELAQCLVVLRDRLVSVKSGVLDVYSRYIEELDSDIADILNETLTRNDSLTVYDFRILQLQTLLGL